MKPILNPAANNHDMKLVVEGSGLATTREWVCSCGWKSGKFEEADDRMAGKLAAAECRHRVSWKS